MKFLKLLVTGLLIFGMAGLAGAATITRTEFTTGAIEYDFTGVSFGTTDITSGILTVSGGTVVDESYPGISTPSYTSLDPMRFDFSEGVSAFGMDVFTKGSQFSLDVYDADDTLLESYISEFVPMQGVFFPGFMGIDYGSDLISYAILDTETGGLPFHMDNIIYQQTGSPVPVPSTILLLGVGLIGFAGIGRKKRKK